MSATAIQSDQEIIDSLTGLLNVINKRDTPIGVKKNCINIMNALLTRLSDTEQQSSVVTSFALDIVNKHIANLQRQNINIPPKLETKHVKLSRNLIRSTQREAAAAESAAATNAARCTGRGCFGRFTRSIKRKVGLHTTPTPPTSPIVSPPYNPQHALALAPSLAPFRRTSKSHGQSRTTPPSLPGMPLGGSRRMHRLNRRGQRMKHRRRTNRHLV